MVAVAWMTLVNMEVIDYYLSNVFFYMNYIIIKHFDHSDILKGGGGGIGSHGADGKGGGMEKGNPGIAPGAAEALSAFG